MTRAVFNDTAKSLGLVAVSLLLLPVSLAVLAMGHLVRLFARAPTPAKEAALADTGPRRTILVTGVGMAKGLALARAFHAAGHRVVGADVEDLAPCPGRFSRSLAAFYRLPGPDDADAYVEALVGVARAQRVDLWVSCSGVAGAAADAAAQEALEAPPAPRCRCVQFDAATTALLHEKDAFAVAAAARGLPVPETHAVASARAVLALLYDGPAGHGDDGAARDRGRRGRRGPARRRRFLLKPVGVDDAHRGDMTLLPLATRAETEAHLLARLPLDDPAPPGAGNSATATAAAPAWILQQFVPGGAEYCSHALVVRGAVRAFVACPSAELLMHYRALPASSALTRAMLAFTRAFVARSASPEAWTGHLSFDFMVASDGDDDEEDEGSPEGFRQRLYAIECNPRAHTAVALFGHDDDAGTTRALVRAYLSAGVDGEEERQHRANGAPEEEEEEGPPLVTPPAHVVPRYWVGHDLWALVLYPAWAWATGQGPAKDVVDGLAAFWVHVLTWQEGTWTLADPMPAVVLYHVYWPLAILKVWWEGRRWSRVNVSTTKMFLC